MFKIKKFLKKFIKCNFTWKFYSQIFGILRLFFSIYKIFIL